MDMPTIGWNKITKKHKFKPTDKLVKDFFFFFDFAEILARIPLVNHYMLVVISYYGYCMYISISSE